MNGVASSGSGEVVSRRPQKCPNEVKIYLMYQHNVKNYVKML